MGLNIKPISSKGINNIFNPLHSSLVKCCNIGDIQVQSVKKKALHENLNLNLNKYLKFKTVKTTLHLKKIAWASVV